MPADWTVPFSLRSKVYTNNPTPLGVDDDPIALNEAVTFLNGTGYYLLRQDGCSLTNQVRSQKEFVPQEDGAILHGRFTGGMEMTLAIQMWQNASNFACDDLLQEMVDTLEGYLYGLLNAGDNEGRITWEPSGGSSNVPGSNGRRMLDDIRLLTYPTGSQAPGQAYELGVTIDCELPYTEDETQLSVNLTDGSVAVTNYGNRPTYPVYRLDGAGWSTQTLTNTTTGDIFTYDDTLPGAPNIGPGEWLEIDTFRNTVTKGPAAPTLTNAAAGIIMEESVFGPLLPGVNLIELFVVGSTGTALVNGAWVS